MRKAIVHLKGSDPALGSVIERVGPYRIQYREPVFDTLVRSIVYQQLSGKAAATIFGRLVAAATTPSLTPESILALRTQRLRALGLSKQKTGYIRDLARSTRDGALIFDDLPGLDDQAVIDQLTQIKGIGVWTAQMFLIFALRRPDVLPTGDLGVRTAMRNVYGLDALPPASKMEELARPWRPWCSVASWYLWRSLDGPAAL
ncbi:MAG: DNA-3-methyladenine glycosylase family protein [Bryobacteraceae bacterium]